jgi:uncharacterized protein
MTSKKIKSTTRVRGGRKSGPRNNPWKRASVRFNRITRWGLLIIALMAISFSVGYLARYYMTRSVKSAPSALPSPLSKGVIPVEPTQPKNAPLPPAYAPAPMPSEKPVPSPPQVIPPPSPHKKICLIIDDFGYNLNDEVRRFLDLDPRITVAILPGHHYSRKVMDYAIQHGHEVIVHAPLEGMDNAEPHFIHKGDSSYQVRTLLEQWFDELPAAIGMNNHQGSLATADSRTMAEVMVFLKQEKKLFVDSLTVPDSQGFNQAKLAGVATARRTVAFLDNHEDEVLIREYTNQWLAQAKGDVIPIAIAHITKNKTRHILTEVIPRLEEMGYTLVPVSQVVKNTWPGSEQPYAQRMHP